MRPSELIRVDQRCAIICYNREAFDFEKTNLRQGVVIGSNYGKYDIIVKPFKARKGEELNWDKRSIK